MRTSPPYCERCLLAIVLMLSAVASAHAAETQKSVLVLFSTGRDSQIADIAERELPRVLDRGLARALDFHSEYIDAGRFPDPEYRRGFRDFLELKYGGQRIDLVIAIQEAAIAFIANYRERLFAGIPVVFFSLNRTLDPIPNATGIIAHIDFTKTVDLARQLQPNLERVFVVSGLGERDQVMATEVKRQFQRFGPPLTFEYLDGVPTDELKRRLAQLPPRSIVYYVLVYKDGAGDTFEPLPYLDEIAPVANRPIYSWVDSTIGHGVLGGSVQRIEGQIDAVGAVALRVLKGESPANIPVSNTDLNVTLVDWRQLRRWGLSEARIPPGATLLFKDPSAWERYRMYILGATTLILAQGLLIGTLLVQGTRRRRAEAKLRTSQEELQHSYERIRDLGGRLIHAQEEERSRIARDLHDDVGQQAALLAIEIELLGEDDHQQPIESRGMLGRLLDRTRKISQSIHDISHQLHPPTVQLISPVAALTSLQREYSEANVAVTLSHSDVPEELPENVTLCLFRIVQEALKNAVMHGRAKNVSVTLTGNPTELTLIISDDGLGFEVHTLDGTGLGLISMTERLDPLGGSLKIQSSPGSGTRIEAVVPLPQEPSQAVA